MSRKRAVPLEVRVKRERACELRLAGATYQQIANELGYADHTSAMYAVKAAIAARVNESSEQVRQQELARLDQMLLGLWPAARRGDTAAVDRVLRVMERRTAFLGLDTERRAFTEATEGTPLDDLAARRAARRSAS